MGWVNEFEQQKLRDLYGRWPSAKCNDCGRIIWVGELTVVDSKGGYFKAPQGLSRYSRPKITYCLDCDALRRGKKPRGSPVTKAPDDIAGWVLSEITRAPHAEWKTRKLIKLWPGVVDKALIRSVVKQLKQEKKIARVGGFLVPTTKTKEHDDVEKKGSDNKRSKKRRKKT